MSCNKFPNKCSRGIGIMSKNQPKFDLMPSHGFWSGRLNVASVENRVSDTLVHSMGAPDACSRWVLSMGALEVLLNGCSRCVLSRDECIRLWA